MKICILGCFDTKDSQYKHLIQMLNKEQSHLEIITVNTSGKDLTRDFIPKTKGFNLEDLLGESFVGFEELQKKGVRNNCMHYIGKYAGHGLLQIYSENPFDIIVAMGGSSGTSIALALFKVLPPSVKKVCLSTMAHDLQPNIENLILIPSIVDIAGNNIVLKEVINFVVAVILGNRSFSFNFDTAPDIEPKTKINNNAAVIWNFITELGLVQKLYALNRNKIAITMFGNTTPCVERCAQYLEMRGYELLIFHATGVGGETLKLLVQYGVINGVLDITTTELADLKCGGTWPATEERFFEPGKQGIPHMIVPGCIDMVNFGSKETTPKEYTQRPQHHIWAQDRFLGRTNENENKEMASFLAEVAKRACGPVVFFVPKMGFSILDSPGGLFSNPKADHAFLAQLRKSTDGTIEIILMPCSLNDPEVANVLAYRFHLMMESIKQLSSIDRIPIKLF